MSKWRFDIKMSISSRERISSFVARGIMFKCLFIELEISYSNVYLKQKTSSKVVNDYFLSLRVETVCLNVDFKQKMDIYFQCKGLP